jgi:hypothetical protein
MIMGYKLSTYLLLTFLLWTIQLEAASHRVYAVHVITLADSTRPNQPIKKIPLRERRWFINYRTAVSKVSRIIYYIMAVVAVACIVFVLFLVVNFVRHL